jgi:hypothetical protein
MNSTSRPDSSDWYDTSLVSVHKWPFSAISASIGGIACAAYTSTPPRNAADFLELAKNGDFWIGN